MLLSSSVGTAGEGEQEAKADRGRVPLARRRSELVANIARSHEIIGVQVNCGLAFVLFADCS